MTEIHYRGWIVESDVTATRQTYEHISAGGAENCGCSMCRNFVAVRPRIYPAEVLQLFAQLGINQQREVEVYHMARLAAGLHLYGAWFHFIGRILQRPDAPAQLNNHCTIDFIAKRDLAAAEFEERALVQLELTMTAPWLLKEEKEPE